MGNGSGAWVPVGNGRVGDFGFRGDAFPLTQVCDAAPARQAPLRDGVLHVIEKNLDFLQVRYAKELDVQHLTEPLQLVGAVGGIV